MGKWWEHHTMKRTFLTRWFGCLHVQRNLWQTFLGRDIPKMRQMLHNFGPKLFRRHIGFKNDGTSYCKCCRKHAFESTQRPGKWPFLKPAFEPSCTLEKGALDFLVGLPWGQACMDSAPWQACWNPRSTHSVFNLFNKKMITWNDHLVLGKATWKKWKHGPISFGSPYSLWLNTPCPFDGCKLYPSIGSWRRLPMFT